MIFLILDVQEEHHNISRIQKWKQLSRYSTGPQQHAVHMPLSYHAPKESRSFNLGTESSIAS